MMRAYVDVRARGEAAIVAAGFAATMIRPRYVLGAGHWWPLALKPFYWLAERLPATRDTARRLGLVTLAQTVAALANAVEHPPAGRAVRIVDVPAIRDSNSATSATSGSDT